MTQDIILELVNECKKMWYKKRSINLIDPI